MSDSPNPFLKFIDLEGVVLSGETPSLKAIFDNLRSYPILVLFFLVDREIPHLPYVVAPALHYLLVALLLVLTIATFAQTAFLFTSLAMGLILAIVPERFRPKGKRSQRWFAWVFANVLIVCFFLAALMFMVIEKVRVNG